jgi:RNA polymerase sigma-70 factor (ECF subfamily)
VGSESGPVEPVAQAQDSAPPPLGAASLPVPPSAPSPAQPAGPDAQRFAAAFAEHAPSVLRMLRRVGVPTADMEDVCQEVFVVLHERWHDFRGDSSLRTWIYGIALRKAAGHRRLKHVRDAVLLSEELHLPAAQPEQHSGIERSQARTLLASLLGELPDAQREVFVLYELEKLTMHEIAALQEVPLHTAYSRLYAAREQLAAAATRLRATGGAP